MAYTRLIEKVALFYKLAKFGDQKDFIKALAQQPSLSGPLPAVPGSPGTMGGRPLTLSEKLTGKIQPPPSSMVPSIPTVSVEDLPKVQPSASLPPIDKTIQDQLNQLLVPTGSISPLKLDGVLGDKTRQALQTFQAKYNMPATPANIKSVYLKEKNPELETKAPF